VENEFGLDGAMPNDKSELPALFSKHWTHLDSPDRVVVSNVSGQQLAEILDAWVEQAWQIKTEYVKTEASGFGVSNAYSDYPGLGVDRWMVIIAAWQRFQEQEKAVCVVDCGTATTIDGISAAGQHLGGFIIPGYTTMQEMLLNSTSDIELARKILPGKTLPSIKFSSSTEEGVNSGCYLAMISIIDRVVTSMQEDYGKQVNCIITGGNAELVVGQLAGRFEYEPGLVLHGLAMVSGKVQ
jgi:type III pantothenate kinase